MFNIKSIVLLATLLKLAAADQCTTDFCRIDCPAPICGFIDKGVSDPFEKFIRIGYKCACKPPLIVAVYPPQYDFLDCEKVKEITPEHDGLQIAGNWVCSSHPYVHNSTAEKPSKPETPVTEPTVADKKAVCDVIVDSEAISPVYVDASAKYQNGDKFKCLGNYIGKSYFRNSYACEKQLDAGFSASNRGKHIVDNTWVCDVTRISDSGISAGLARISAGLAASDLARISANSSKSFQPKAPVTDVSKPSECTKEVCDVIAKRTSRVPGYDAAYQDGDKCLCLGDYIGKSYLRKEYNCEKQLDAGFSASNRGKHIVQNTWVCDVRKISDRPSNPAIPSKADTFINLPTPGPEGTFCSTKFCRKECDAKICDVINDRLDDMLIPDSSYALGKVGDECACHLEQYYELNETTKFMDCEKVVGIKPEHLTQFTNGEVLIRGNWICTSHDLKE